MQVDALFVKRTEQLLKHLSKELRNSALNAGEIGAYAKLLSEYGSLIRLSREDEEESGFYEMMEAEALKDVNLRR